MVKMSKRLHISIGSEENRENKCCKQKAYLAIFAWHFGTIDAIDSARQMHGGALLKAFKILSVVAVVLFASSIVRADGVDGRINVNPGPDPILPSCGSAQFFADSTGAFNVACDTTVNTPTITFG